MIQGQSPNQTWFGGIGDVEYGEGITQSHIQLIILDM